VTDEEAENYYAEKPFIAGRDQLATAARMAWIVSQDESQNELIRDEAWNLFVDLDWIICFKEYREVHLNPGLLPRTFTIGDRFYADQTEQRLALLLGVTIRDQPVLVQMARQTADLVDEDEFSFEMRADSLHALNRVLESLTEADWCARARAE
jgi:hypothetical protein